MDEWRDFLFELHRLFSKTQKRIDHQELLLTKERIDYLSAAGEKHSQTLQLLLQELLTIQSKLQQTIMSQLETFSLADRIVFVRLFQFFDEIERIHHCFTIYLDDWRPRWVKEYLPQNEDHGLIEIHDLEASLLPETKWYPRYERIIYTSGTLKFGNNKKYLPQRLGLTEVTFKTLPTPYNYAENARVYVPEEAVAIQNASSYEMGQYISDTIEKLMAQEERSMLVLFTSHELLSTVYHQVQTRLLEKGQEVLAQGISGSREKILKRFSNGKPNVLLGADSFWEGVDLPGTALQLLIVTRLPFENPKRPLVQAKYAYLEAEGIQPFAQEAVPKAALRLRQALGRLIRSEEDRGALLILDRRLVTAKYGKRLIKAFPKGLSVKEAPMPEILEELKEFLNK